MSINDDYFKWMVKVHKDRVILKSQKAMRNVSLKQNQWHLGKTEKVTKKTFYSIFINIRLIN